MTNKNWLEWTVFALSGVVLSVIFAFLAYNAVTLEDDAPDVEVRLGTPLAQNDAYVIPVTFKNHGGQSIEDVQVDVTLMQAGVEAETASITVPLLPRQSTREGWVLFSIDPAEVDEIQTQIVSYIVP
jgi:uncharacterized protein (TIGR02588 family)